MTELIANGESLALVRAKMNATLRPYASRAEFEAATIPAAVPLVNVIHTAGVVYQLTRDAGGDWESGDGATWVARALESVAAGTIEALTIRAEDAAAAAEAAALVVTVMPDRASWEAAEAGLYELVVLYDDGV